MASHATANAEADVRDVVFEPDFEAAFAPDFFDSVVDVDFEGFDFAAFDFAGFVVGFAFDDLDFDAGFDADFERDATFDFCFATPQT